MSEMETMQPIVCLRGWQEERVLLLAFEDGVAVYVSEGGQLSTCHIGELVVERPTMDFPSGFAFSKAQAVKAAV